MSRMTPKMLDEWCQRLNVEYSDSLSMCRMVLDPDATPQKIQIANLNYMETVPVMAWSHKGKDGCSDGVTFHLYCHKIGAVLYVARSKADTRVYGLSSVEAAAARFNKVAAVWAYLP